MKVLVVGGGGREHALVWKLAQSPLAPEILCAPGNPGTAQHAKNTAVQANDVAGLVKLAQREAVDLVVIGPEEPLCLGLADKLRAVNILAFGPGAAGARIEGSKVFAKELLERHKIPCATDRRFDRSGAAKSYLEGCTTWPQVVKADGLASGKGVFVCADARSACAAVDAIMENKSLGSAGAKIVVEEFLVGEEASVLAITDGETILILEPVVDHKQLGDGDTGPNTGGMGVYSPVPMLTRRLQRQIEQRVLVPAVHALRREEIDFRGVLYAGLMITESGPKVLEFNARFGDPEAQALVRRLKGDLLAILLATAKGELASIEAPDWDPRVCVGVVAAAEGYPANPRKGDPISGVESADEVEDAVVFHAGTARQRDGDLVTAGGRVFCVTALGAALDEARARAYSAYDRIAFHGKQCRHDIGLRVAARPIPVDVEGDDGSFEPGAGPAANSAGPGRRAGAPPPRPARHASGFQEKRPAPGGSPP
ncbi:MAG TPA: phosphoribosylamine--glycine ligase [Planctomycetota bacterium]|jgi:phosphoribosylamine--glycine ligase|nr:phosphoribosylamine--glycine ligase [Planctomycetota bacterium]